jgi:pimeloyl-ACP methyl ester carboxylesterase
MSTKAAAAKIIQSRGASVEVFTNGAPAAGSKYSLVALACGGGAFSPLAKLGWPVSEMQLRGYGAGKFESASDKQQANLSDYVGDIDAVVRSAETKQTVLLGYSHGGYFTTAYALANPAKVSGLILIEPALFNNSEELHHRARLAQEGKNEESLEAMLRYVQPDIGLNPEHAERAVKTILQNVNNPRTLANELTVRADNPISEGALAKLNMPVLLIGGTESHVSNIITRFHHVLPTASLWWIRGAEHTSLMSEKFGKQLEAVVNAFMAGLD